MALDKFQVSPRSNLTATVAPTASDDSSLGYSIGSLWVNTTQLFSTGNLLGDDFYKTYSDIDAAQLEVVL